MKERVQLNTRVCKTLRSKVWNDANKIHYLTRDVVVSAILTDFFSSWSAKERLNFYKKHASQLGKISEV